MKRHKNQRPSDVTMTANVLQRMFCVVALSTAGCAAEAHWDSARLRDHAMNYYTDQIMDNLIRARNGRFFLHVNINNLQAQVISEIAGTVQGGQTLNNTNSQQTTDQIVRTNTNTSNELSHIVAGTLGIVATATNYAVRPFTFSATPRINDQLTFGTVPEVNDPPIYMAYMKFLNAEPDKPLGDVHVYKLAFGEAVKSVKKKEPGDQLVEGMPGNHDPSVSPGHYHYYVPGTLKRFQGQIYYVPIAFSRAYFELCLELAGRITLGNKGKAEGKAAGFDTLPPKNESPQEEQLKRIEQKLNSLPQ